MEEHVEIRVSVDIPWRDEYTGSTFRVPRADWERYPNEIKTYIITDVAKKVGYQVEENYEHVSTFED